MASENNVLSYATVQDALESLSISLTAAELHGNLCGHLSSSSKAAESWLAETIGVRDGNNLTVKTAVVTLSKALTEVRMALNSESLDFHLLLPDESNALPQRLQALSHWCDSFLYALGVAKIDIDANADIAELVKDLAEIARVDFNDEAFDTEAELDFLEITEYVKVGALLIYDTYKPAQAQPIDIPQEDDYLS